MNATYENNIIQHLRESIPLNHAPYPTDRELALNLGYEWVEEKTGWVAKDKVWDTAERVIEFNKTKEEAFSIQILTYEKNSPPLCNHAMSDVKDCIWKDCTKKYCTECGKEQKCPFHHVADAVGKKCKIVGYPTAYNFWGELTELVDRGYKNIWVLSTDEKNILKL
ncbi:MAG TPA: hypothetical protein PKD85_03365 [Saprospiraceae bacterium]|mgnify:CR=1 FL=1|nr:hypothetical protein [Saprospiraceae bacterium]